MVSPNQNCLFTKALETARGIEDDDDRARALRDVAAAMAKAGLFERALETAREIEDGMGGYAFASIAASMAETGLFDRALGTAFWIEDDFARLSAYQSVAIAMAGAGRLCCAKSVKPGLPLSPDALSLRAL